MSERQESRLILVRHGESEATVNGIIGGPRSCTGLSERGQRQAQALRDRWTQGSEPEVDVLWSSTMPRAAETAAIVNETLGLEHHQEKDLEEWRPGDADGMTWQEATKAYTTDLERDGTFARWAPNSESMRELHFRAGKALDETVRGHEGQTIMCVVHSFVIDVAFRLFLGLPQHGSFYLATQNTSITELTLASDSDLWQLHRYNDAAHLNGLS